MQEIRVLEEKRLGKDHFKDFDLAAFARITFGMYGWQDRSITLEGENHLVGVIIDRFGTDVMIFPHGEEHFHASVTVSVSPQFFGWLVGLGLDEDEIIMSKMAKNEAKYPVEKARGSAAKYDQLME